MDQPSKPVDEASLREGAETDRFAAVLTQVAYGVALRHGVAGSFADFELELWRELQVAVGENLVGVCRPYSVASRG